MNWCRVSVVQSETISDQGHILNILRHMFPQIRWVSRTLSISKFDAISPNVNWSSQIMPAYISKIFHAVMTTDPSIVSQLGLLWIFQLWKIGVHDPISFFDIDLVSSAFNFEISNSTFNCASGIAHETSHFLCPAIIHSMKYRLHFFYNALSIFIVSNHEEICSIWHF